MKTVLVEQNFSLISQKEKEKEDAKVPQFPIGYFHPIS